jgi:hypothetical protein
MSDNMSDMKTFTVRQMDREPAAVLDTCDRDGVVRIRRRDGRAYTMRPESTVQYIKSVPDFKARIAKIFPKPIPRAQAELVDRMVAGE